MKELLLVERSFLLAICVLLVVLYSVLARWWRGHYGQFIVAGVVAVVLFTGAGILGSILGDYPGKDAVLGTLLAVESGLMGWLLVRLVVEQTRDRGD